MQIIEKIIPKEIIGAITKKIKTYTSASRIKVEIMDGDNEKYFFMAIVNRNLFEELKIYGNINKTTLEVKLHY
jgi:hypothetical protein